MKILYRISLFFTIGCIVFGVGSYINSYQYNRKIGDEESVIEKDFELYKKEEITPIESSKKESAITAGNNGSNIINCDTNYMVESFDVEQNSKNKSGVELPAKYIGMTRIQLEEELAQYSKAPTLKDQEKGFVGANLVLFSQEEIVVQKTFSLPKREDYYLAVKDNFVVVYESDQETIYLNTSIFLEELPMDLQIEIMNMKYVETEEEVYHFLESHSS